MIAEKGIASKLYYLKQNYFKHRFYDKLVFDKMKNAFGGRVRVMVTSSAPISRDVLDFIKVK